MDVGNEELAKYLRNVLNDYEKDNDTTRALRRLHMKEVHMQRRGKKSCVKLVKNIRRML